MLQEPTALEDDVPVRAEPGTGARRGRSQGAHHLGFERPLIGVETVDLNAHLDHQLTVRKDAQGGEGCRPRPDHRREREAPCPAQTSAEERHVAAGELLGIDPVQAPSEGSRNGLRADIAALSLRDRQEGLAQAGLGHVEGAPLVDRLHLLLGDGRMELDHHDS